LLLRDELPATILLLIIVWTGRLMNVGYIIPGALVEGATLALKDFEGGFPQRRSGSLPTEVAGGNSNSLRLSL
jgi:hypothetical protein